MLSTRLFTDNLETRKRQARAKGTLTEAADRSFWLYLWLGKGVSRAQWRRLMAALPASAELSVYRSHVAAVANIRGEHAARLIAQIRDDAAITFVPRIAA